MKAICFAVAVCICWLSSNVILGADPGEYLTYADFISRVESGLVKSVELSQFSAIQGRVLVNGEERPFQSFAESGGSNDPLLNNLLREKGVAISLSQEEREIGGGASLFLLFLGLGVPVVALVLVVRINSKVNRLLKEVEAGRQLAQAGAVDPRG